MTAITEKVLFDSEEIAYQCSPELLSKTYLDCIAIRLILIFPTKVIAPYLKCEIERGHPNHIQNEETHHERMSLNTKFCEETDVTDEISYIPRK